MTTFMTVEQARSSVRQLEKICSVRPTAENLAKLSQCYFTLEDREAALRMAHLSFSKDPNSITIALNLGLVMKDIGAHDEAHNVFKMVFDELYGESDQYVRLAYSESLLRKGLWKEAWPIYDTARSTKEASALTIGLSFDVREWNGKSKVEQLLVIDEGGVGDRITYCRWLPVLTEMGVPWKFFVFPELRGFFERASWCGTSRLANIGEKVDASHWTTTFSLPANLCSTVDRVPKLPEFFKPLEKFVQKYKMQRSKLPTVGLCWTGDETRHGGRKVHSLSEGQAMRLVCRTDHLVNWVNLQFDRNLPEPVTNVKFDTWEELAGLISNLDMVVSVETGPMCLAHALGKNLVVLLSSNSDWKFLESGNSPFYPEAELVRNGTGGGLEKAVDKAIDLLFGKYEIKKIKLVGD